MRVQGSDLRLEVLVQEDVIAVELEAVLVVDDHLLDTLEAVDKYVIDVLEELSDPLSAVLGGEEPPNLLDGPLAYLRGITADHVFRAERRGKEAVPDSRTDSGS